MSKVILLFIYIYIIRILARKVQFSWETFLFYIMCFTRPWHLCHFLYTMTNKGLSVPWWFTGNANYNFGGQWHHVSTVLFLQSVSASPVARVDNGFSIITTLFREGELISAPAWTISIQARSRESPVNKLSLRQWRVNLTFLKDHLQFFHIWWQSHRKKKHFMFPISYLQAMRFARIISTQTAAIV